MPAYWHSACKRTPMEEEMECQSIQLAQPYVGVHTCNADMLWGAAASRACPVSCGGRREWGAQRGPWKADLGGKTNRAEHTNTIADPFGGKKQYVAETRAQ